MTATPLRNIDLDSALEKAKRRHTESNPKRLARFEAAHDSLPGGSSKHSVKADLRMLMLISWPGRFRTSCGHKKAPRLQGLVSH